MNKAFVIISTGHASYGEMALNLCLSLKSNSSAEVILIHDSSSVSTIVSRLDRFDMTYLSTLSFDNPSTLAFYLKLTSYEIVNYRLGLLAKDYEFILLDADTMIIPGKKIDDWFMNWLPFVAYYNDSFDFRTNEFKTKNYHFWCNPLEVKEHFKISDTAVMPQINASFIYFRTDQTCHLIFHLAREVWTDDNFPYVKYRGSKTEELCFNIAMAKLEYAPHKVPFRPIFVPMYSEQQDTTYIQHRFNAFTLAGHRHSQELVDLYNRLSDYYRRQFGIQHKFHIGKSFKDDISLKPRPSGPLKSKKIVLTTRGAFGPISNGGCINPGAFKKRGNYSMLIRSDANFEGYKGKKDEAYCVPIEVEFDYDFNFVSARAITLNANYLVEDFRLMEDGEKGCCSAFINGHWNQVTMERFDIQNSSFRLVQCNPPSGKDGVDEKNWAWFETYGTDNFGFGATQYYIYSIEPFIIYSHRSFIHKKVVSLGTNFGWNDEGRISCSTFPVRYSETEMLVWVHKKQADLTYLNSAMIFDINTFKPKFFYPGHILDSENIEHPMYVSSCIVEEDRILLFSGEKGGPIGNAATEYSSVRIIDRKDFDLLIKQYPVTWNQQEK